MQTIGIKCRTTVRRKEMFFIKAVSMGKLIFVLCVITAPNILIQAIKYIPGMVVIRPAAFVRKRILTGTIVSLMIHHETNCQAVYRFFFFIFYNGDNYSQ